jgi:hypothetical protein
VEQQAQLVFKVQQDLPVVQQAQQVQLEHKAQRVLPVQQDQKVQ